MMLFFHLEEVTLIVEVDADQVVGMDGKSAVHHGPETAYHDGRHRIPSAGMCPRSPERHSHHVELEEVLDLQIKSFDKHVDHEWKIERHSCKN
jgi:hypothetical protein